MGFATADTGWSFGEAQVQHTLLLLRRQGVEVVQTLAQLLLALRRKLLEIWVLLEFLLLLFCGELSVVAQPVSSVRAVAGSVGRRLGRMRFILRRWTLLALLLVVAVLLPALERCNELRGS